MIGKLSRWRALGWIALSFLLVLAGCATTGKYQEVCNSWLGSDVNSLIASWGPPSNEYNMPNGSKMYTWVNVGGTQVVANYNEYLNMATANSVTYWCKTTFTVNSQNVITNWQGQGNGCRVR